MNDRLLHPTNYALRAIARRAVAVIVCLLFASEAWHVWRGAQKTPARVQSREASSKVAMGVVERSDTRVATLAPEGGDTGALVRAGTDADADTNAAAVGLVSLAGKQSTRSTVAATFSTRVARGGHEDAHGKLDAGDGGGSLARRADRHSQTQPHHHAARKAERIQAEPGDALSLARVCFLEAGFRYADCAAIHAVIATRSARAGVPYADMLRKYSAITARNDRARWVRTLPDGDSADRGEVWNRRWAQLRQHAAAVLRGEVGSPCARADHWGSRSIAVDVARAERAISDGRWRRVRCKGTVNAYYVTTAFKGDGL